MIHFHYIKSLLFNKLQRSNSYYKAKTIITNKWEERNSRILTSSRTKIRGMLLSANGRGVSSRRPWSFLNSVTNASSWPSLTTKNKSSFSTTAHHSFRLKLPRHLHPPTTLKNLNTRGIQIRITTSSKATSTRRWTM